MSEPYSSPARVPAALDAAAAGRLPDWAEAGDERRAHIGRVAALLEEWAGRLRLPEREVLRWRACAWLHDALRDADPERLRPQLPPHLRDLPGPLLHGPAAAARLAEEGVDDQGLLCAVAYHTVGHPDFDQLGRALYLADFLEPGRHFEPGLRAGLRARLPEAMTESLRVVVAARVGHLLRRGHRIRLETLGFWNTVAAERP